MKIDDKNKTQNNQALKHPNKLKVLNKKEKTFDLEQRLKEFFETVLKLCKKVPLNARTTRIISQLTGSSGSIATNYAEASEAMSKKILSNPLKYAERNPRNRGCGYTA